MAGTSESPYTIAHADVFIRTPQAAYKYSWNHVEYPMDIDPSQAAKGGIYAALGNYLQSNFGSIGFVGEAKWGSVTSEWQAGEAHYVRWIDFVTWLQAGESVEYDALWMGFHDYASAAWNDPTGYYNKLKAIIDNVRTDTGLPNLPVINTFLHNVSDNVDNNVKKAIDVNYELGLLDNVYSFTHGVVQEKLYHNDHFTDPGFAELGPQIGWHTKQLFNGTPIDSGKFVGIGYVGDNVFRAEISNPNGYTLTPQRPSDIRWYNNAGTEIKSKNTLIDNNYVYSWLDVDELPLPNTIIFRHQHGDYPEACQWLHFVSDVNIPVDKTGLVFETNNKIELSTLYLGRQSDEIESIKTKIKRGYV